MVGSRLIHFSVPRCINKVTLTTLNCLKVVIYIKITFIFMKQDNNIRTINGDWGLGIGVWGFGPKPKTQKATNKN
jgi:hypothetical protein